MRVLQNSTLIAIFWAILSMDAQAQEHFIRLDDEHFEIPAFPGFVEKVIDVTPDKPYIGYAQTGMGNRRSAVRVEGGLDTVLQRLFQRSFPLQSSEQARFLVRINHLLVYERTYSSAEVAYVEANISFWVKEPGGYREVYEASAVSEARGGIDVTRKHARNIIETIQDCCKAIVQKKQEQGWWKNGTFLPDHAISAFSTQKSYPLLKSNRTENGVWKTFNDFRDDHLLDSASFDFVLKIKDTDDGAIEGKPEWKNKAMEKRPPSLWGLQWEGKTYLSVADKYYQLIREGENFYLLAPELIPVNYGVYVGGILGGFTGSFLLSTIESDKIIKGDVVKYQLDLQTGKLVTPGDVRRRRIEARQIVYASTFLSDKHEMIVSIDGKEACRLKAGEYYRFSCKPQQKSITICASLGTEQECRTIEPKLFYTEIFLLRSKRGKPDIDLLNNGGVRKEIVEEIKKNPTNLRCEDKN